MLHTNVIEKSGFRTLNAAELEAVSGGEIVVIGGGGGGIDPMVRDELTGGTNAAAIATLAMAQWGQMGNEIVVEGERGSDDDYDSTTIFPIFPYFYDTDTDDFKEFLVEELEMTAHQAENEIIVEAKIGNQEIIVHFNGDGDGAIYIVHDNTLTDDDFVLFSEIKNAFFTKITESRTTSINEGGGSISLGNGIGITFERVGPND